MTKVGKNIKKIRSIKGLSQQAFSDLFYLSRGNISSYEELRAEPKIETIIEIAKYFSIPLNDFILKDLSVNELLHFNSSLVTETEKLKNNFIDIPYISSSNQNEYVINFFKDDYLESLPKIRVPNSSPFHLLAIEIGNSQNLPEGFSYKNGDILIYEKVEKENVHRIIKRLGIKISSEGIKIGIFNKVGEDISLVLNNWVNYSFAFNATSQYWVLRAVYLQEL